MLIDLLRKGVLFALGRPLLEKLLGFCSLSTGLKVYGHLYLFTYAFLLRMPSEALMARKGRGNQSQSRVYREGDTVVVELQRR